MKSIFIVRRTFRSPIMEKYPLQMRWGIVLMSLRWSSCTKSGLRSLLLLSISWGSASEEQRKKLSLKKGRSLTLSIWGFLQHSGPMSFLRWSLHSFGGFSWRELRGLLHPRLLMRYLVFCLRIVIGWSVFELITIWM